MFLSSLCSLLSEVSSFASTFGPLCLYLLSAFTAQQPAQSIQSFQRWGSHNVWMFEVQFNALLCDIHLTFCFANISAAHMIVFFHNSPWSKYWHDDLEVNKTDIKHISIISHYRLGTTNSAPGLLDLIHRMLFVGVTLHHFFVWNFFWLASILPQLRLCRALRYQTD